MRVEKMVGALFSKLSDDVVLNIFNKLEEDDPRHLARASCVCTKFSSLIRTVCWKDKCCSNVPSLVSDLLLPSASQPAAADSPAFWASLHKLSVCCPGLTHSGVLLENSDFGLERELGPDENYPKLCKEERQHSTTPSKEVSETPESSAGASGSDCTWSLFDDLYFDTVYNSSEMIQDTHYQDLDQADIEDASVITMGVDGSSVCKKRKICGPSKSHLACGVWNLSREQGSELLATRLRDDCLYLSNWPGCVHVEEKRSYMIFRGFFKEFKRSRVWRTIKDGNRSRIDLDCAFCDCKETWDLHSAFCLRKVFGYHDDGEPVVRAYVCENGHVSGAWTESPLCTY